MLHGHLYIILKQYLNREQIAQISVKGTPTSSGKNEALFIARSKVLLFILKEETKKALQGFLNI